MKRVTVVLMALLLVAGVAWAKGYEVVKKAGEYEVEVTIDKNPPAKGENNISIEIEDAAGKYVTDAKVTVEYSMAAMPGMPPMNYKAEAKLDGDEYKAKMDLSMSGPWSIAVKIKRGEKTDTMKFSVDVR